MKKYFIYHIFNEKIGCTNNIKRRVEKEQGCNEKEYEILFETFDLAKASAKEIELQKKYNYKQDNILYKELIKKNNMKKIESKTNTTTFKIPIKKITKEYLEGFTLINNCGTFVLNTPAAIDMVHKNIKASFKGPDSCYIYNKILKQINDINTNNLFEQIREWAKDKQITNKGDSKTQLVKLSEEVGELSKGILENNKDEIKDAIGDIIVVLTNLATLNNLKVEECINTAYKEIKDRKGKMVNGTFVKN